MLNRLGFLTIVFLGVGIFNSYSVYGETIFSDDFSDNEILTPAFTASSDVQWKVISGKFTADGTPVGNNQPETGQLNFGLPGKSTIQLDLSEISDNTPVEVSFKLRKSNFGAISCLFTFILADRKSGKEYRESPSPNPGYYGGGGFYSINDKGEPYQSAKGIALNEDDSFQTIKMRFDPEYGVTIWKDAQQVASWSNFQNLKRVDRFILSSEGTISWFVDDVVVIADRETAERRLQRDLKAIQTVYRGGVPHTDKRGRLLMKYDPNRSFFQIGMWGTSPEKVWGHADDYKYKLLTLTYDYKLLTQAGFNTVWPWVFDLEASLKLGEKTGMQIVYMREISDELLAKYKDHANLLGNVWYDEPTGGLGTVNMEELYGKFLSYQEKAHQIAPDMPVFVNNNNWITGDITDPPTEWFIKWNTAGDVSCHDNYPIQVGSSLARTIGAEPSGIPQSVLLAVSTTEEKKLVWLIVGAFTCPDTIASFRFSTPEQLRAMVYASIIHGATGIIYFTWDTYVPRDGKVIGISPNPEVAYVPNPRQPGYTNPFPATPLQMIMSRTLWDTASQINQELKEMIPVILSPTVGDEVKYKVSVKGESVTAVPVRCLLKPYPGGDNQYVLFTVNVDDAVLNVTYTFPKPLETLQLLFENRPPYQLEKEANSFTERYEPFATKVFLLKIKK